MRSGDAQGELDIRGHRPWLRAPHAGITSSPLPCELSVLRVMGQTILLTPCMHRIAHAGRATGTPRRLSGQA